ncbi:MAG: alanine--tRNA ligase [Actinobacteria bacterium]|nr:alanine--tRNA ligase [Actinomycetota bacterium]MCZ6629736.1 alanine--tRNA ligase [Actinomycetota bacterium]
MDSNQIRQAFTDFFVERDHEVRPSASLIPVDPTLLITNAGMVPFKPFFLGDEEPPWLRVVSIQKCVRTIDIDIIGTTKRHLSFFEMMGNFSFGDYFKETAIPWGYEFCTETLGLDPERMWYTVHDTDEEAAEIWIDGVGVPAERVQRGGNDNFWQMGVPGPAGPSSEIFWDRGEEFGSAGGPIGGNEDRYLEIWNLVFMQNVQDEPYHVVGDLPAKNIDTGMGLDRIAVVLQDVPSVFDIDTTREVLRTAERYTRLEYGANEKSDISLRILADHGRAVTFLIGDGVVPSNDGRGYVLRRVLRKAVRHAWQYGVEELIMPQLVESTIELMGGAYPALAERKDFILDVVTREEEKFRRTLESGHQLLDTELSEAQEALSGAAAFKLHDTFGFPIDLTKEIAAERGVDVDLEGFEVEMSAQRERARASWKGGAAVDAAEVYRGVLDTNGLTEFVGYDHEVSEGVVLSMVSDAETLDRAEEGREVEIFLDKTPFYAESGGQVGDTGVIETETGSAVVVDTQHVIQGLHGHRATVTNGYLAVGQTARTTIDSPRREAIRKSHTGTHVLHWALRDVLGDHAEQAGSFVEPGRIRFDFSHFSQVASEQLAEVELEVNARLVANHGVTTTVTSRQEAETMGALAFFGDKYGETVRVVKVGEFSTEFCGGTHASSSGQVGPLVLLSESSIGSNLRRVEALTGMAAYDHLVSVRGALARAGGLLRVSPADVPGRLEQLLDKVAGLEKDLAAIRAQSQSSVVEELAARADKVGESGLVVADVGEINGNELRQLALGVRDRLAGPSVVIVGSAAGAKGALVAVVSKDLMDRGISAAELIGEAARELGGGGSRDPELAQAGGPKGGRLGVALEKARTGAEQALAAL